MVQIEARHRLLRRVLVERRRSRGRRGHPSGRSSELVLGKRRGRHSKKPQRLLRRALRPRHFNRALARFERRARRAVFGSDALFIRRRGRHVGQGRRGGLVLQKRRACPLLQILRGRSALRLRKRRALQRSRLLRSWALPLRVRRDVSRGRQRGGLRADRRHARRADVCRSPERGHAQKRPDGQPKALFHPCRRQRERRGIRRLHARFRPRHERQSRAGFHPRWTKFTSRF